MCQVIGCRKDPDSRVCGPHKRRFEHYTDENLLSFDFMHTCTTDGCNNLCFGANSKCADHGGPKITIDFLNEFEALVKKILDADKEETLPKDDVGTLFNLIFSRRSDIPTVTEMFKILGLVESKTVTNNVTSTNGATKMAKITTSQLTSEAREVAIQKVAEKLLKTSRKQAPKMLAKLGVLPKQYAALVEAFLDTDLGQAVWNILISGLATYAPEIPVKDKFKGIQATMAKELRKATMGNGIDAITALVEPLIEGFFGEVLQEEAKYAGLEVTTQEKAPTDFNTAEEPEFVVVGAKPAKARASRSNR